MADETAAEVVDAEVVPDGASSVAVVHQPRRGEVLRPLDVGEQKAAMQTYQAGLREILDHSDWQNAGRGESFVKKSGWRKIAAWFDLSIEMLRDQVERDEHGHVTRACVWARAVAPSGRFADGDGYCAADESRFQKDKGRQKLENDLRGTATTRAVNRAISNLVGMGAVSAEEVDTGDGQAGLPYGPAYDKDVVGKAVGAACVKLAGDAPRGIELFKAVARDCGGYMPAAAAHALLRAATADELPIEPEASA